MKPVNAPAKFPFEAWTDYPFVELGDIAFQEAPIRKIIVDSYDGDKYCKVIVKGLVTEIKAGYIYLQEGRCGAVPSVRFT